MDKALNQLSVPLGQLREEVLVSSPAVTQCSIIKHDASVCLGVQDSSLSAGLSGQCLIFHLKHCR